MTNRPLEQEESIAGISWGHRGFRLVAIILLSAGIGIGLGEWRAFAPQTFYAFSAGMLGGFVGALMFEAMAKARSRNLTGVFSSLVMAAIFLALVVFSWPALTRNPTDSTVAKVGCFLAGMAFIAGIARYDYNRQAGTKSEDPAA